MLLRKYMALLGIGSAQIDLILPKETYRPGEHISGYFLIKGGTIEQQIIRIDCDLVMINQATGIEKVIDTITLLTSKLIQSGEVYKESLTFKLSTTVLVTTKEISYRFKTKVTFKEGVESRDQDIIQII
ncbi:sporulation protein [Pseudalkalibacillus sp. A8]|uniref:sporulation protein n=1 Tax=Pseudalkalibacillus sp. A8 TaxID=3382641 RepID=UPI0038B4E62D